MYSDKEQAVMTAVDLKRRAEAIASATDSNSVSPQDIGALAKDTVSYIEGVEVSGAALGIRKTYASVSAMEADGTSPAGDDGKPLRQGQLVSIYDPQNESSADNGKIFSFSDPGWNAAGKIGADGGITVEDLGEQDDL